jgi:Na+/proline symporter
VGVMFAAIFAAQMSTLSAQMVNSSALASRNLYKGLVRPDASDAEVLIFGRVSGLFLVSLGVLLAFQLNRVATALTMLLGFSSIMGVVVWGGVLWRRANRHGAWAAVLVLFTLWALLGPIGMIVRQPFERHGHPLPSWIGQYGDEKFLPQLMVRSLPGGVLALVVVSLLTKPPPAKQVDDFFLLLRTPVGEEQRLIDAGVPIVYAGSTQRSELESRHPALVHWGGFALAAVVCALILLLLWLMARIGS